MAQNNLKEIYRELVSIDKRGVFNDEATLQMDEENPLKIMLELTPKSGFYEGGRFKFRISLPKDYPNSRPTVSCLQKMYHPNISHDGHICFNILSSDWDASIRVEQLVNCLLWLLQVPNLDSRLNGNVTHNMAEFERLVRVSMAGGKVNGTTYPRTLIAPMSALDVLLMLISVGKNREAAVVGDPAAPISGIALTTIATLPERNNVIERMPLLLAFNKAGLCLDEITLFVMPSTRCYSIVDCARLMRNNNVCENEVVKELVLEDSNSQAWLVLAHGAQPVNLARMSKLANTELALAKRSSIGRLLPDCEARTVNIGTTSVPQTRIVVHESILRFEHVYMKTGLGTVVAKVPTKMILQLLPAAILCTDEEMELAADPQPESTPRQDQGFAVVAAALQQDQTAAAAIPEAQALKEELTVPTATDEVSILQQEPRTNPDTEPLSQQLDELITRVVVQQMEQLRLLSAAGSESTASAAQPSAAPVPVRSLLGSVQAWFSKPATA
ncbi:hypothetical protein CAOG_03735 [Capsaspora owczarzaki ATCC 30864]|uniref:UBC core domain-containing protein n=1 Tax=Capsaspora owczarzaki (strain ATCC 30864) TaxID=595528 RepID=A0A0D2WPW3_CAPO3|nr:hypothetical protein CAOG_03735 [Capsaspora owczarzaki ATCC 30864]KJE92838.1 hypothetical protein CAOG_003735 [Capsaspora owczarzaki ATCC 30864]|eukprot:XP_004363463.1 hypothetical protein CAOG_03735 [Capsaspora owczarzaki ATCC 30864]